MLKRHGEGLPKRKVPDLDALSAHPERKGLVDEQEQKLVKVEKVYEEYPAPHIMDSIVRHRSLMNFYIDKWKVPHTVKPDK